MKANRVKGMPLAVIQILRKPSVSIQTVCYCISEAGTFGGKKVTPEQIFNSSPTGELYPIMLFFNQLQSLFR